MEYYFLCGVMNAGISHISPFIETLEYNFKDFSLDNSLLGLNFYSFAILMNCATEHFRLTETAALRKSFLRKLRLTAADV